MCPSGSSTKSAKDKDSLASQFRQVAEKARRLHIVHVKDYLPSSSSIPSKAYVMPVAIPDINTSRHGDVNLRPIFIYVTQPLIMHPKKDLVISVRGVDLWTGSRKIGPRLALVQHIILQERVTWILTRQ